MDIAAVDATTKYFLLGFGAIVSLAGLWLIFRPPGEGGKTILHLFGLKFEAASAGILVFVVGIGVVTLSLFTPTLSATEVSGTQSAPATSAVSAGNTSPSPGAVPAEGGSAEVVRRSEPQPISLDGAEIEPNNSTGSANLVQVGASVVGRVSSEDRLDIYKIDTERHIGSMLFVTLNAARAAGLQVLEPTGKAIFGKKLNGGSTTFEGPIEFGSYTVRIGEGYGGANSAYELIITVQ